jgi:hypothetical protein
MKTNLITRFLLLTTLCIFSFYFGKEHNPDDKIIIYQNPAIEQTTTTYKMVTAKSGSTYEVCIVSNSDGLIAKAELRFARDRNALIACISSCPQSPGHIDSQCALNCLGNYINKDLNDPAVIAKIPIIFYLPLLALKGKLEACLQNNTAEQCVNNNINEIDNLLDKILKYL